MLSCILAVCLLDAAPPSRGDCEQGAAKIVTVAAEVWHRILLEELDNGRWRSAGTFENPSRDNCLRYGRGWVEGSPRTRRFSGPFAFTR